MKEDINNQLRKLARELKKYSELEGSEVGEACASLIQIIEIAGYPDNISDEFKQALKKEIKARLQFFKDHCKIVTKRVKYSEIVKELEWDY